MSSVNGNRYPDNEPNKDMTKPICITSQSPSNTKPIDLSRLKIRKQIEAYNSILSLFITQGKPIEAKGSSLFIRKRVPMTIKATAVAL